MSHHKFTPTQADLQHFNGQFCDIVRQLTRDEADIDDVGPMFLVRFADGEISVFADELSPIPAWTDQAESV